MHVHIPVNINGVAIIAIIVMEFDRGKGINANNPIDP